MNQTTQTQDSYNIAFVKARWHADIVERCEEGFLDELRRRDWRAGRVDTFAVPGSLEIPLLARQLALRGDHAAIVASGLIVDGGIYRHDFVASTVIDALMRVQLETDVPVLSAVLTPHHFHEHAPHTAFFAEHFVTKGREAAQGCLAAIEGLARLAPESRMDFQDTKAMAS
ncbi:MAG: 6,7-dimethyl-8-ribityllumazine synthase [Pseudomonadota bacterium]